MLADKENEPAIDNFNICTENGLAGPFTEEKSGRGITAVTDKEIRRRNEERISQTTNKPKVFENGISQM